MSEPAELTHQARFTSTQLPDTAIRVTEARGTTELSGLWEFHLSICLEQDVPIDAAALLESAAALYWERDDATVHTPFFGVVREVELLEALPGHWIQYRVVLVPNLWYLSQTFRSRVFLDLSVPDVVDQVLGEAGFEAGTDYQWSLADRGAYPVREYIVQYEESDLDFISRLFEHEGIFFYATSETDAEVWTLGDQNDAFVDHEDPISYDPRDAADGFADHSFRRFQDRLASVPKHVVTRDYASPTPGVRIQQPHQVSAAGMGLVFSASDHLRDAADATRLARVRAEEIAARENTFRATGSAQGLRAGHRITLQNHPVGDLDGEYVVVEIRYEQTYGVVELNVELIRATVPYRPPRVTPRPRIYGFLPAHVDGEVVGVPAPLDDQGRYRVVLPFDSAGQPGGTASRWIRMAQTFSGPGYGMHFPLHVGTEVLIAHLDGDPDRPLIVGSVPNPQTVTPVVDTNATQSIVRSKAGIVQEYEDDAHP
ncbi:MAG: type VI secretion system tip protein VgrG [Sandaracinaceae bacterium]|nr:type VI secretion system tip protein VgrG [Sandaracinaceae bacterium]